MRTQTRLLTDGRVLAGPGTGVATYARALARAQAALSADVGTIVDDGGAAMRLDRPRRWLAAAWPGARRLAGAGALWRRRDVFRLAQVHFDVWRRPLELIVPGPPGIVHWSYPLPITVRGWHNVYTVHDAIPLVTPDLGPIDGARHRRLLAAILRRAAAIVTVSGAARQEIAASLGVPADGIVDCGQSIEAALPVPPPDGLEPGRYLLVCGTVEKRKNVACIVRAYRASGLALPLVVAGPTGWQGDEAEREIAATAGAIRHPYLADPAMRALIAHAGALVMPSLAEGFGLPVAEAMAHGVPVLTSASGALREVAGGAALLVDPLNEADIAAAMVRIVDEEALRTTLAHAGRARAAAFSPDRFAARLGAVYAAIASASGGNYPAVRAAEGGQVDCGSA